MASNAFPKQFKGLWVPVEVLQLNDLNVLDKLIIARIWAFPNDGCYQSNATYASQFGVPIRTVEDRIARLLQAGWLLNRGRDHSHRLLFVNADKIRKILRGRPTTESVVTTTDSAQNYHGSRDPA